MIVTKSSLLAVGIVKRDKDLPKLDNVVFEPDGTVVACARNVVIAVSPPDYSKASEAPVVQTLLDRRIIVPAEYVRAVVKEVKTDKTFGGLTEYVDVYSCAAAGNNEALFTWIRDGESQSLRADLYDGEYIPYRDIFKRSLTNPRMTPVRVKMYRARLKTLCDTLDKIAPNDTEAPVYIEFAMNGDMIMRAVNRRTGQRVVAVMTHYSERGGDWLLSNDWERGLCDGAEGSGHDSVAYRVHRRRRVPVHSRSVVDSEGKATAARVRKAFRKTGVDGSRATGTPKPIARRERRR